MFHRYIGGKTFLFYLMRLLRKIVTSNNLLRFDQSLEIERNGVKSINISRNKWDKLKTNVDGSTSVTAKRYTTEPDVIITLEKVEDDHRWLMSVQ